MLRSPTTQRLAKISIIGLWCGILFFLGVGLRQWTWEETTHLRFQHDIVNGFYWGSQTLAEARQLSPEGASADTWPAFFRGYFGLYERVEREAYQNDYQLDYPPLRLLVMSVWAKHVRHKFPGVEDGTPDYVEPLLRLNLWCEALSAAAVFFLVRLWVRRASGATNSRWMHRIPPQTRGTICGFAAAAVAWLDPSLILDAHGWPQWDVWILPFYLFGVIAASRNRWYLCGCLLGAGAMLKGQLLLVAPFFLFWPLWQGRWGRALRVLAGFAFTAAVVVSPWLLRTPQAWGGVALAAFLAYAASRKTRHAPAWTSAAAAVAAFGAGAAAGGSFSWLRVGFFYGSEKYPYLFVSSCYNLPSLLADLGWGLKDHLLALDFGPVHLSVTPQWGLRFIYLAALAFCALGAAKHVRNRDPRLLIAISVPWLLMFALLGQMHERYLMWGGVVSSVALGVGMRFTILTFVISAASTAMILHVMLLDKKLDATLGVIDWLAQMRPYASWVILASVAVWFCEAISTRAPLFQRRRRENEPEAPVLGAGPATEEI